MRESDLPAELVLDRQRKIQIEAEMAEKQEALRRKRDKQGFIFINTKYRMIRLHHYNVLNDLPSPSMTKAYSMKWRTIF